MLTQYTFFCGWEGTRSAGEALSEKARGGDGAGVRVLSCWPDPHPHLLKKQQKLFVKNSLYFRPV